MKQVSECHPKVTAGSRSPTSVLGEHQENLRIVRREQDLAEKHLARPLHRLLEAADDPANVRRSQAFIDLPWKSIRDALQPTSAADFATGDVKHNIQQDIERLPEQRKLQFILICKLRKTNDQFTQDVASLALGRRCDEMQDMAQPPAMNANRLWHPVYRCE